ncbi:Cna B-type domain-containing protein [Streptococcus oralis]|uniref:Surface-anchored protein n=1 Tax=Streptococcus oralis subsp. oralis TaxID=1891914 RepID=A0A0F2DAJ7_STROR|nr:Cna B-type domain-containing protein [Streptococcus oralis]KEQ46010.1 LPXTG-motif cell wall anchor domain protein [Streptococcus oralis]KJQ67010.1 surface-anchored protein [Streptococcus oralis subsp. oralis]KJQ70388.1 surface-anchored protein [Streptococcus oralis subsp. oralis]MBZ2077513.1 Cna B-type domain-containing protein [Streptococcus oralis]
MKNKKFWLYILTSLACLLGIIFAPNSVEAKELKNVISNIGIWEVDNGRFIKPDANGVYTLSPEHNDYPNYKFIVDYDLSAYDGKLEDGDTFTFTVPGPLSVKEETFDLKDKETDLVIGEAKIVSNGDNNGGKATITLKNLKTYLEKKKGIYVQNVRGSFYLGFSSKNELSEQTLRFEKTETINEITYQIRVGRRGEVDYSEGIGKANFSKYHGLISKEAWTSKALNKSGQYLHTWYVRVNPKQASYDKIEIHDWVDPNSSPMQMIPESLSVIAGWYNKVYYMKDEVVLEAGKDYEIKWNDSYTEFTITINNASSIVAKNGKPAAFRIGYKTSAPGDGTKVLNNVEVKANDKKLEYQDYSNKTVLQQIGNSVVASGGTIQLETAYRIILYKVDELTHDRLKGAKFKITPPAGATAKEEIVTTNDDGIAESSIYSESDIKKGNFTVTEIEAPEGYELNPTPFEMTVGQDGAIKTVTNKRSKAKAKIKANKKLTGRELKAEEFEFTLTDQDGKVKETVKNDKDGNIAFSELEFDKAGTYTFKIAEKAGSDTSIKYDTKTVTVTVTIADKGKGALEATVSYDDEKAFENTYTPAKTEIPVKKVWKDENNQDGKRPTSVTVKLLADGQDTGKTLELNAANGWAGSFKDLDADKGGTPIQYTVVEVTVAGYTSEITGDAASGFTITNSYSPETVDVKATKNWDDANNQDGKRPTKITINLLADGQKVDSKEIQVAADGTWTATFEKLAKYKAGKEIKYTVTEEAVAEYEATITDFTITNKYAPKAIDYKVTKVWNDANNQDGKRPESVTVQLYKKVGDADPVAVEGKKLTLTAKDKTDANTWVASFTNLPQYEAGKEITYSIKEVDVPAGYEASVTGQVVTNTHNPDTVILSGTKVWKDNNNQDGKRTTSVKVQILKNDKEVVQEIEVSEATGWKFESKALPKYENGKLIKYTVKEVVVKGYTSTITTEKEGKYTITNEYTPEKIAVSGQKTWIDNNDQDRMRPASVTVALLANGKETGKTAIATAETGWKYEFTELDRYQNGKAIEYTVKEVGVSTGYTATETGMNVTNTHTPEKTSVKGKKIWKDEDNKDGIRPASITVKLLADGKETGQTATVSETSGWTYEFTGLDRYQEGKEIAYTVEEVNVPDGYTASVEGYNITNTHTPEKPTPGKPNEPGKPKKSGELPNTGSESNQAVLVAGIALLGLGTGFLARRKKED